ncbi:MULTISPECIES: hypothetical protein [unclassified Tolypothrix]|uniref:hypothetical protein n=1 Tax=unclassified Tolypothrix TaxID=2649714 RepID=UPI000BBC98A5|nr:MULTISPECIES: hypothetical protein [unclassified Tolypothrix]MBE9081741.1 hypothetical protein [Tolypothrix sp. LEGE 11397]UYD31720.1 hypothetical protein HG267_21690 [Tolypothrix sp. PCC 7601]
MTKTIFIALCSFHKNLNKITYKKLSGKTINLPIFFRNCSHNIAAIALGILITWYIYRVKNSYLTNNVAVSYFQNQKLANTKLHSDYLCLSSRKTCGFQYVLGQTLNSESKYNIKL